MGIKPWVIKWIKQRYPQAFPAEDPGFGKILIVDMMQYLKYLPDGCECLGDILWYVMNQVRNKMRQFKGRLEIIILCFDQKVVEHKSNKVKSICYAKRYKNANLYKEDEGPFLPKNDKGKLPDEWTRFCGNSNLLRRELFPLIYNCCLDSRYIQLNFGQTLILQGLPGRTIYQIPNMKNTYLSYMTTGLNDPRNAEAMESSMQRLVLWNRDWLPITPEMEEADPDMYNNVYMIKAVPPGVDHRFPRGFLESDVWKEAKNNLGEADLAMVYFNKFFPEHDQIISINDGDIYPIALLHTQDRLNGSQFKNRQLLVLPQKKRKPKEGDVVIVDAPRLTLQQRYTYCDVNMLYSKVCDDPLFGENGVQNHVMMLVLMIILSGTDFFADSFGGVGCEKFIWKTLTGKFDIFHHLIQSTKNIIPDPLQQRHVVFDEYGWRQFAHWCYAEKYGPTIKKKTKSKKLTHKQIRMHLSKRKREDHRMPDRKLILRWCRQIQWNIEYWLNGPRLIFPDPFRKVEGQSYYGYELEDDKLKYATQLYPNQIPVDEVYGRHFGEEQNQKEKKPKKLPSEDTIAQFEQSAKELFQN